MVFQTKSSSAANAAYIRTNETAPAKQSITTNNAAVKKLIDYFAIFDGSPKAAKRFQQSFNDTFHPDVIIELPGTNSNLDYKAAVECIQACINKGGRADLLNIVENNDGTATMTICNNVPGLKDDVTRQVAYFNEEGKVIRVHAIDQDAGQFGNMVSYYQRCVSSSSKPEVKKLVEYFAILDGSPEAAKRFEQVYTNTFHPDVVCDLPGNNLDYKGILDCVQAGLDKGSRADLLDIVENDDGTATMTICNNVPGLTDDVTRQVVAFKDEKVVRIGAVDQDAAQFANMVSGYQRCISLE